jgi:DNA-binding winged helix-turn-helix (wHTH) protein
MGRKAVSGPPGRFAFAPYRLDADDACLWRGRRRIPLTRLDAALLGYLASRPGRLVTHAELLAALWPGITVSAGLLKVRVRRLRRVLRDRADRPRYIESVHGQGYRFIAGARPAAPRRPRAPAARTEVPGPESAAFTGVRQAVATAMRRQAPHEAIALARTGLAVLEGAGPAAERRDAESELRIALGRLQLVRAGYTAPEVTANYARLRRLCEERPDEPALFPALVALTRFALNRAEIGVAHDLALRTLRIATAGRHRWLTGAHMLVGAVDLHGGRLVVADDHLRRALALHDRSHTGALAHVYGENIEVPALGYHAVVLWYRGYPEQARRASAAAVRAGRALHLPAPLAFALGSAC